jgi:hypothetical protein
MNDEEMNNKNMGDQIIRYDFSNFENLYNMNWRKILSLLIMIICIGFSVPVT